MKSLSRRVRQAIAPVVLALATTSSLTMADTFTRVCVLRGIEEVPANNSPAVGCGRFVIDTCANTLTYHIVIADLSTPETAAHIHGVANPGVNAGVLIPLPAGPVKIGTWTYPETLQNDLLSGRMYVNVHTTANPGGEVRGQIVTHVAVIDAVQETPTNASTAQGFGVFTLNTSSNTLSYYIGFAGLTSAETAAHIHGFVNYGSGAGVLFPLPAGNPKVGTITYTEAMEQGFVNGLTYANIHTVNFPGGEIRGQIVSSVNPMNGGQEVPANASTSAGCTLCAVDTGAKVLGYDLKRSTLATAQTASHIHGYAPAGVNAGVITPIAVGPRSLGTWTYGAANEVSVLVNELTYTNEHTTAFPGGEIRGQLRFSKIIQPPCVADVDNGTGTGTPDGGVGIEDLLYYLVLYNAGTTTADVDDGSGEGCHDGGVGIEDLLYFLSRYNAGC